MAVFLKNILRSIKANWLSIFSLVFFISIISTVFSAATNLTRNLTTGVERLNEQSHVQNAVIDENYDYGKAKFSSNDQNKRENRIISAIGSTYVQIVKPENGKLKYSEGSVLLTNNANSPPTCTRLGASFETPDSIYNFIDPGKLRFDSNGNLLNTEIEATWQCGVDGQVSQSMILSDNSSDRIAKLGFSYVKSIFNGSNKSANESKVTDSGFQDGYVLSVRGAGDASGKDDSTYSWFAITKQKTSSIKNDLVADKNQWSKSYSYFNNYFSTNDPKNRYNLTSIEIQEAKSYLKNIPAYVNFGDVSINELSVAFDDFVTKNTSILDDQSKYEVNNNKFAQIFLKLIYYYWTQKRSLSLNTLLNDPNTIKSALNEFRTYIGTPNETNDDNFSKLSTAQKYIFSSTNYKVRAAMAELWKNDLLTQIEKKNFYFLARNAIMTKINSFNIDISNHRLNEINKFVIKHNLWTINDSLTNFQFQNPITKKLENYDIVRNTLNSIIVNTPARTQTITQADGTLGVQEVSSKTYKIVSTPDQATSADFVNKLIIYSGNDLFYNQSYNDYKILQRWLKLRQVRKSLNNTEEIPFFEMLLRAKFSSASIRALFQTYLNVLKSVPNSFLSQNDTEAIRDYTNQIQAGNWRYNGYYLELSFTAINYIKPLSTIGSEIQKITQVPSPAYITNKSADFAVISPTFAQINNKQPISNKDYRELQLLVNDQTMDQAVWEARLSAYTNNPVFRNNVIDVNGTKVIVVGIGLTADFAFPSISLLNLIPNAKDQGLLYVNSNGYSHFLADNPAGFQENYISIRYPQAIIDQGLQTEFFDQLGKKINNYSNKKILFKADDTSMIFSASAFRMSFVNNIISVLNLVGYLLIGIVAALTLFGVVVLIRRYTKNNSMIFGNLGANGVSKLTIILSTIIFVLIPSILGPVIGYFIGLFTQSNLFEILRSYWFLSSSFEQFSFLTMIYYVLVPLVILSLVAIITAAITLRPSSLVLMRENPVFKQTRFSLKVNNLFNSFSPLWKFRFIVAVNSTSRILLLSGMSSLMLIVLMFVFSNINQFSKISSNETDTKRYGYAVEYNTPTAVNGQSPLLSYQQLGQTYLNNISQDQDVIYQDPTTSQWTKTKINFNSQNPLFEGANIQNFFQNASSSSFADTFKTKLKSNPTQALVDLNKEVHINPFNTNYWAQNSILTQFMLRSIWDNEKSYYKSFSLPTPTEAKDKLFFNSSQTAFKSNKLIASGAVSNYAQIEKQSKLFTPYGLINESGEPISSSDDKSTRLQKRSSATTYEDVLKNTKFDDGISESVYYADYVPFINANTNEDDGRQLVLAPDGTPLFQPLSEQYRNKKPLLANNNGTGEYQAWTASSKKEYNSGWKTENSDFYEFDNAPTPTKKIKLPLLNRLYRDNANYWIFSIDDRDNLKTNLNFLRNRVLVKLLLNHTINISGFGTNLKINLWDILSSIIGQKFPGILNEINENNNKLIRSIIQSRYAPFFVNRFLTMQSVDKNFSGNLRDGETYFGEPSYYIAPSDLVPGVNTSTDPKSNARLIPGVYYLDSRKTLFLYVKFVEVVQSSPYSIFSLFRPDFLYLMYAILNDPAFASPATGPTKLTFNNNVAQAAYDPKINPVETDKRLTWTTTGIPETDVAEEAGITAGDSRVNLNNYLLKPDGDQTFTYLRGRFANESDNAMIYGLKQDIRGSYFKLSHNNEVINQLLYQPINANDPIPIIINRFAARKLNASVGSVLNYAINNTSTSTQNQLINQNSFKTIQFKVVGINDTYYNNLFFISQENANRLLNLNPDYGYNGIFIRKPNDSSQPIQFSLAPAVFAKSGLYTSAQFDPLSASGQELLNQNSVNLGNNIIIPSNLDYIRLKFNLPTNVNTPNLILEALRSVYGSSPILPLITTLDDSSASTGLFVQLSDTMQALVTIILIIFIPLLVIMVMMVTSLVIDDLRQLSIIMIMLGFNNWENIMTVLTYLFPVLLLSLIIGLPASTVFLNTYIGVIFSSISLLLPIKMLPWYFIASVGILTSIFGSGLLQSYLKLKKIFLPIAMKALGD